MAGPLRSTLFFLALPVLAEQMLNTFIALFDTWLAGRISATATGAVGLAAYVGWLASMIVMMVGTGTTALVARYVGSGCHARANRYTNQSMTLAAFVGVALFLLLYSIAPALATYSHMTGPAHAIAVHYLRVDAVGHIFMSLTLVGCAALRGAGNMRTPMALFALINTLNVIASCMFVYGFDMGVRGIVAGTVTARIVGAFALVAVLIRGRTGLILRRRELRVVRRHAARILRIGLPAAADGTIMWSGHFVFLGIVTSVLPGMLGEATFAAHIIAIRVEALTYLPAVAWASAAATMIGQSLGAGNPARAKQVGHEAVLQCGLLSLVMSVLFFFGASWIYEQMTLDPLVRAAGAGPFRVLALFQPLLVVSIIYVWGMRGAGDTRFPMLITLAGVPIRLVLGYYFGIVEGLGLLGAWTGMFADMIWRALASSIRYFNGKWLTTKV